MDPERKIAQARVTMLYDHPFFGYLATGMILEKDENMIPPTMATDGRKLYYHPEFVENTPLQELMGVIAHEIGHCVWNHIPRRQNRNKERWNYAADYAVNDIITKEVTFTDKGRTWTAPEFVLPAGCLHDPQWADTYVEYIYNRLPEDFQEGNQGTLDSHGHWDNWGENGKGKDEDASGALEQEWREQVAQAANAARMRGKLPGHLDQLVGKVLRPELDWKDILRDIVTSQSKSDYKLLPPNKKHIYRGIILPGITGEELRLAVAIDSSGSIHNKEIEQSLGCVYEICEAYEDFTVYLFVCDSEIHERYEITPMEEMPTVVSGRGGTDFQPVFDEVAKLDDISSLVYVTDLEAPFPEEPSFPVIWVAVTDRQPPYGTVIRIPRLND